MSAVDIEKVVGSKTVTLKPVKRAGWLPPGHDGEFRFSGTGWGASGPEMDSKTRQLKTGLTEDEERSLEKKLNLSVGSLSRHNKDYWAAFTFLIPKEGMTLYLDNPKDYIIFKILSNHSRVAKTMMEVKDSPGVDFYMTSYDEESKIENDKNKLERESIKAYGKLSTKEMTDVLKIYAQLEGKVTGRPSKDSSVDFIESTLYKKMKSNPEEFLRIVGDSSFSTRVLIDDLISNRILIKNGSKYSVYGGDVIGSTLESTIEFLEDPRNQGVRIELLAKLESINK